MLHLFISQVKTHTEDALHYLFHKNKEKYVILGNSIA